MLEKGERVIERLMRQQAGIDEMQFGFIPGCGSTNAIFILRQLQEKYLAKKKNLYFAIVDLKKCCMVGSEETKRRRVVG